MNDHTSDFSAFFLEDTSAVEIDLPNDEPMLFNGQRVTVHVYGPSTQVFIDAKTVMDREAAKNMVAAMGVKQKTKDQADKDADAKFLTAITASIENFPFPGGVSGVYREPRLKYMADQVRTHINDLGNFFAGKQTA